MRFTFSVAIGFLLSLLLSTESFAAAGAEIHISEQLNREKNNCTDYLRTTIERGLKSLGFPETTVYVGMYDELVKLLVRAGLEPAKAQDAATTLRAVLTAAEISFALRSTTAVLEELIETKKLFICTISARCPLGVYNANHMLFTDRHEGILMLPPPVTIGVTEFTVNFISSIGMSAAERILMRWLFVGYQSESKTSGSADFYYRKYAGQYDGKFPPSPDSASPGFVITFITLYQMLVADELFSIYRPADAQLNRRHLRQVTFEELTYGRNRQVTVPVVRGLRLDQRNLFEQAAEITRVILRSVERTPE